MNVFGFASFGAAFVGFAGLSVLLAFALHGGGRAGRRLLAAVALSAAWALVIALDHTNVHVSPRLIFVAELVRDGAWLYALIGLAPSTLPRFFAPVSYGLWLAWAAASFTGTSVETVMSFGGFCMALLMLLLLEQVYRNAPEAARPDLKFLAIGVGGLFTYDLFLYAQAVLLHGLDAISWYARGFANTLLIPLLLLGARRLPDTNLKVFVSRQVTFYTTTFLAAGIYLLVMSLAGYAIREFGGA